MRLTKGSVRSILNGLPIVIALSGCAGVPRSCGGPSSAGPVEIGAPGSRDGRAVQRLQCDADRGDIVAAVALGRRYELGDGVPRDPRRAARLYRAAAAPTPATTAVYAPPVRLGGRGQVMFQANANTGPGSAAAQFYLGRMYLEGRGVKQDRDRGRALIDRAAAQGFPGAAALLKQPAP